MDGWIHLSAITFKPMIGQVNKINCLITGAPCHGVGYIRQQENSQFLKLMCWKKEKWTSVKVEKAKL